MQLTPRFSDTFRAFKECPWDKLNTVILGLDPYPGKIDSTTFVADGLAFSSKYSTKCPKSLNQILSAIDRDVYKGAGFGLGETFDLTKWANQGILLINCALTYPIGQKSGAHINLWYPFITYVLKTINQYKDTVAIALMGREAKAYRPIFTNEGFGIYTCEHPSAANHRGGKWKDEGIFGAISAYQGFINNIKIDWEC